MSRVHWREVGWRWFNQRAVNSHSDTLGRMNDETRALIDCLDGHREHVLDILNGLSDDELRTSKMPSGWDPLGMVRHLALDVEHYWFRCIVAGEPLSFFPTAEGSEGGEWRLGENESPEDVFNLYRSEIERSNAIIASTPLLDPPAQRDTWWGDWPVSNVRFIILHVIGETACHAGHLDATRELFDGRQYMSQ